MKAIVLSNPASTETQPPRFVDVEVPKQRESEVLVRVDKCGVCRTHFHAIEGDIPPLTSPVIPGH